MESKDPGGSLAIRDSAATQVITDTPGTATAESEVKPFLVFGTALSFSSLHRIPRVEYPATSPPTPADSGNFPPTIAGRWTTLAVW